MRGFGAFMRKEFAEIIRTWRIWVLPGIVLFFAISGPVIAEFTPELLKSVAADQPGVVFEFPEPSYVDSYLQWTKNLAQIVTFAVIIIFGGIVSAERKSGTAILVLTKPVTRPAFVAAKFVSQAVMLAVTVAVGAVVTWGITAAIFGEAPFAPLAEATGAWLVFGVMFLAVMTLLSVIVNSQAGAAGTGLAVFLVLSILTLWGPALDYSPAGLVNMPTDLVLGEAADTLWPLVTGALLGAGAVIAAAFGFKKAEL